MRSEPQPAGYRPRIAKRTAHPPRPRTGARRRPTAAQIRRLAAQRLGFEALRPGQLEGVQSVLSGRDTLCIMSTGSGKSAMEWGEGSVVSLDEDQLTVAFDSVGYRTLALDVIRERGLLTPQA